MARLAAWQESGLRLVMPGDAEWPTQLDDLGDARPLLLWLRGAADLRLACVHSVSMVGSRAATGYGNHVAIEMAATLAERGVAVISGGAYGIDASSHRGALAAERRDCRGAGRRAAVRLPARARVSCSRPLRRQGVLVSECPPDRGPTRPGFLVRNRIIAALSRGTVVVEAALRSGALNSARHARELCRPVMAVPGPVTSEQSAGLPRADQGLRRDVRDLRHATSLEHIGLPGEHAAGGLRLGPRTPRDMLDPAAVAVLEEVPVRGGRGPASIAVPGRR